MEFKKLPLEYSTEEFEYICYHPKSLEAALFDAVKSTETSDYERIKAYLEAGFCPDAVTYFDGHGVPLLWTALHFQRWQTASLLVKHGATLNSTVTDQHFPASELISEAITNDRFDIVTFFLEVGVSVNYRPYHYSCTVAPNLTLLHRAILGNHKETAELLVSRGADLSALGYIEDISKKTFGVYSCIDLAKKQGWDVSAWEAANG